MSHPLLERHRGILDKIAEAEPRLVVKDTHDHPVLRRTLLEAAVRAGQTSLAERLIDERLVMRPTGQFALARRLRLNAR